MKKVPTDNVYKISYVQIKIINGYPNKELSLLHKAMLMNDRTSLQNFREVLFTVHSLLEKIKIVLL